MATCTFAVGTADTGAHPNTSGSFSTAVGDLLIVLVQASGTVDAAPTCVGSVDTTAFSLVAQQTYSGTSQSVYVFVADALCAATTARTVTVDTPGDPSTGGTIFVYRVSGMSRVGLGAIRQFAGDFGTLAATPGVDLAVSALTGNPTLVVLGNITNPAGVSEPTGWTEDAGGDLGYNSPPSGAECAARNSGFTGTAIDWAGASPSAWGAIGIELDASVASLISRAPRRLPLQGVA